MNHSDLTVKLLPTEKQAGGSYEKRYQEEIFKNLRLLTILHKPSSEFKTIFKKDMFSRPNCAACLHTLHYLISILNPKLFESKNLWPVLDKKIERAFFTRVISFINEDLSKDEACGIPKILLSNLVVPTGISFLKFMLKLTQFVMYTVLSRDESCSSECLYLPIKVTSESKAVKKQLEFLKIVVSESFRKLLELQRNYEEEFRGVKKLADELCSNLNIIKEKRREAQKLEKALSAHNETKNMSDEEKQNILSEINMLINSFDSVLYFLNQANIFSEILNNTNAHNGNINVDSLLECIENENLKIQKIKLNDLDDLVKTKEEVLYRLRKANDECVGILENAIANCK